MYFLHYNQAFQSSMDFARFRALPNSELCQIPNFTRLRALPDSVPCPSVLVSKRCLVVCVKSRAKAISIIYRKAFVCEISFISLSITSFYRYRTFFDFNFLDLRALKNAANSFQVDVTKLLITTSTICVLMQTPGSIMKIIDLLNVRISPFLTCQLIRYLL